MKGEKDAIPIEWAVFEFKPYSFYFKVLYESLVDLTGSKNPEVTYEFLVKY